MFKTHDAKDKTQRTSRAGETQSQKKRKAACKDETVNRQHGGGMARFTLPADNNKEQEQEMDSSEAELNSPTLSMNRQHRLMSY
jgi:hypothetical protein